MDLRLLAMGTLGDVRPYVALGLGLQRAGFDVTLCSTADFRTLAEDAGLPCLTAREDLRTLLARCRTTRAARWAFFDMVLRETPALAAGADALIYSPAFLLSAPHVVERSGVPALLAALQPFLTPTRAFPVAGMPAWPLGGWYNRLTYAFVDAFLTVRLRGRIDRWRAQALGLPPYRGPGPFAAVRHSGTPMLYGFSPTVLPKPADWVWPSGVTSRRIDRTTGKLATEFCPLDLLYDEYFANGTEPTDACDKHAPSVLGVPIRRDTIIR